MADEVFRYQDGDRDELVVLFYPGDETIVVNSSSYGEPSRVPLPREEGIKLARAILAALGKDADGAYTPEGLESLPEGVEVEDEDGDIWVKNPDGAWYCPLEDVYAGSTLLVKNYGPITAK